MPMVICKGWWGALTFFFSSRRRHTRYWRDWSSDVCSSDLFEHHMSVRRIWEAPRVTLPYSELQWGTIDALGKQVDADLRRMDVRLTQGGEPTFVSIDDREGGEWNTEAMGPTKRALSGELMARLRQHYGAGGLVHYGQGKWYPG